MTDNLKLKIYPAVIGVLGICLIASLFSNVQIEINRGSPSERSNTGTVDRGDDTTPEATAPAPPIATAPTPAAPTGESSLLLKPPEQTLPVEGLVQGGLRVSNQTGYPLRVALLPRQPDETNADPEPTEFPTAFSQPVHWDFAPGEGKTKGLILSLPNQDLQLQSGDVLVAFAQDGSRRYWGPYVVGKTSLPVWNADTQEWLLILQP